MKTAHEFYQLVVGNAYDLDGFYGAQCWDGAMKYSQWLGKPIYHCGLTGYVKDIWNQRKSSGILNHYDEVKTPFFKDGDIIVWGNCAACPDSHIAIFRRDNGNGTFIALGQNQGGSPYPSGGSAFNQRTFSYDGILGGFRPKMEEKTADPKPAVAAIPESPAGSVYRMYNPNSGDHLYTLDLAEARALQKAGWKFEGIAWRAPEAGSEVLRLYKSGYHHFTADQAEAAALQKAGWKREKMAFYSGGSRPIYRMYNPNSGSHILTADSTEHDRLTKIGWKCEGQPLRGV